MSKRLKQGKDEILDKESKEAWQDLLQTQDDFDFAKCNFNDGIWSYVLTLNMCVSCLCSFYSWVKYVCQEEYLSRCYYTN